MRSLCPKDWSGTQSNNPTRVETWKSKKTSALLVIDIQQEDFLDMPEDLEEAAKDPRWDTILKGKRVLDVFRKK